MFKLWGLVFFLTSIVEPGRPGVKEATPIGKWQDNNNGILRNADVFSMRQHPQVSSRTIPML